MVPTWRRLWCKATCRPRKCCPTQCCPWRCSSAIGHCGSTWWPTYRPTCSHSKTQRCCSNEPCIDAPKPGESRVLLGRHRLERPCRRQLQLQKHTYNKGRASRPRQNAHGRRGRHAARARAPHRRLLRRGGSQAGGALRWLLRCAACRLAVRAAATRRRACRSWRGCTCAGMIALSST